MALIRSDPAGPSNDAYVFKVDPAANGGKPQLIKNNLDPDAVSFAADFAQNLAYVIVPGPDDTDVLQINDAGNISLAIASFLSTNSRLGTDSGGNVYVSRFFENSIFALPRFSPAPNFVQLFRFPNTGTVQTFDIEGGIVYTDEGKKFGTLFHNLLGTFALLPNIRWFAADALENILFGDNTLLSNAPQVLTLQASDGTLQDAGQLPRRAERADF